MTRIVLDTETTGVEDGSRILELAAVALDDNDQVVAEFCELVDPGMPLPPDVTVNGITADMLADAPSTKDVLDRFENWASDVKAEAIIAHYAPFDLGMLNWEGDRVNVTTVEGLIFIDTCAMAKAIKATKKNGLDALVEHYGIQRQGTAHRAMSDVLACLDYYRIAKSLLPDWKAEEWNPTYGFPTELPAHLAKLPDLVATGKPFAFAYQDAKGNMTDRVITPYGYSQTEKGIYFHGLCHLRNERRTFQADRVVFA